MNVLRFSVVVLFALMLGRTAFAQTALADQSKAAAFLAQVKALPDAAVVFAIPARIPFDELVLGTPDPKPGSPAASITVLRLCETISALLLSERKIDLGNSIRAAIAEQFRVSVHIVDCSPTGSDKADLAVITGANLKQMMVLFESQGRLIDPNLHQPTVSFRIARNNLDQFLEFIQSWRSRQGRIPPVVQGLTDLQKRTTAAANQRQQVLEEQQRVETEKSQRKAQEEADQSQLEELKRRAISGDHDSAIKVVEWANATGDRATAIQFQIVAAEIGTPVEKAAMAERLLDGSGGFPKDPERARKLLQQAVDAGDSAAMLVLAKAEAHHNGLRADNAKALELYQRVLQSNASAEIKEDAKYALESLNKSIDENEKQKTEDVTLAKRIRDLGWFGRVEVHPVAWNKQFAHYVEFAQFSFTSKGLVMALRDDLSDQRRTELKAAGIGGYTTPLQWKDDLCWETKRLLVGKDELPYQPFGTAAVPNDDRDIAEVVTAGCVSRGKIEVRRDWAVETRGGTCGSFPRGPRGGCLLKNGKLEDREEVTFALGPAAAPTVQTPPPASVAPVRSSLDWNQWMHVCQCSGLALSSGDVDFYRRAKAAIASSPMNIQPECDRIAANGARTGDATAWRQSGWKESCVADLP